MKIAFFDTHRFERSIFEEEVAKHGGRHQITFLDARLTSNTALLCKGHQSVCAFVNDSLDAETLAILAEQGVKLVALRSAGFNHVDLKASKQYALTVVRVPAYSPHAVAEHAAALVLTLNRKIHRAYQRVRELNFSLDGLVGFDLHGKTVGVVGTGNIGAVFAKIMSGFGCTVLAHDPAERAELVSKFDVRYVGLKELFKVSDVISLHVPLTSETRYMVDSAALSIMKRGIMLINTSRGALIDTKALIDSLKTGQVGAAGLDVYEEEEDIFFRDLSERVLTDDVLARLLTFPQVIVTAHQGFLTSEALHEIARTTLCSIDDFEAGRPLKNRLL